MRKMIRILIMAFAVLEALRRLNNLYYRILKEGLEKQGRTL